MQFYLLSILFLYVIYDTIIYHINPPPSPDGDAILARISCAEGVVYYMTVSGVLEDAWNEVSLAIDSVSPAVLKLGDTVSNSTRSREIRK